MKSAHRSITVKTVLCVTIPLTLLFIFINSALPPALSSAESEAAGGFLTLIFPEGTLFHTLIVGNIRKIAHFAEFFVLGIQIALWVCLFTSRYKLTLPLSLFAVSGVAALDEVIQIFSGRGPSVFDVMLDVFGASVALGLVYSVYFVIKLEKR